MYAVVGVLVEAMGLKRLLGMESSPAELADEVAGREVERDVALQVVVVAAPVCAMLTLERLGVVVVPHVTLQGLFSAMKMKIKPFFVNTR